MLCAAALKKASSTLAAALMARVASLSSGIEMRVQQRLGIVHQSS